MLAFKQVLEEQGGRWYRIVTRNYTPWDQILIYNLCDLVQFTETSFINMNKY